MIPSPVAFCNPPRAPYMTLRLIVIGFHMCDFSLVTYTNLAPPDRMFLDVREHLLYPHHGTWSIVGTYHIFCAVNVQISRHDSQSPTWTKEMHRRLTGFNGGPTRRVYFLCCSSAHQPSHFHHSSPTCPHFQGSMELYSSSSGSFPNGSTSRALAPPQGLHRANDAGLSRKGRMPWPGRGLALLPSSHRQSALLYGTLPPFLPALFCAHPTP